MSDLPYGGRLTSSTLFSDIRKIEIHTKQLVDSLLAGAYLSAFKGKGIEFNEVKEYFPGDDVRSIDWNVTARMGHPYVKNFHEERELTILLLVDCSSSSLFGSGAVPRNLQMAEVAALLTFSAMRNSDKVGMLLFSDKVTQFLAPKKGSRHALRIIRELLTVSPAHSGTNMAEALAYAGKLQQSRAVCFVLSDFLCPDFSHELAILARKHDLIALIFSDPAEREPPDLGLATFADLETGELRVVDTGYAPLRKSFQEASAAHRSALCKLLTRSAASYIELDGCHTYLQAIKQFFQQRGRQRR